MGREDPHFLSGRGHPAEENKTWASESGASILCVGGHIFQDSLDSLSSNRPSMKLKKPSAADKVQSGHHRWQDGLFTKIDP